MMKERTRGEIFVSRSYTKGTTCMKGAPSYWTYLGEKKHMDTYRGGYVVYLLMSGNGKIDWHPIDDLENLNWI